VKGKRAGFPTVIIYKTCVDVILDVNTVTQNMHVILDSR